MGTAVGVAGLIISAISAGYSIYSQEQAKSEAEDLAEKNAERIEAETAEEARRAARNAAVTEARAKAALSGLNLGGQSTDLYLKQLHSTNQEQISWIKTSGAMNADVARAQGDVASATAEANMANTIASTWTQMSNQVDQMGQWYFGGK